MTPLIECLPEQQVVILKKVSQSLDQERGLVSNQFSQTFKNERTLGIKVFRTLKLFELEEPKGSIRYYHRRMEVRTTKDRYIRITLFGAKSKLRALKKGEDIYVFATLVSKTVRKLRYKRGFPCPHTRTYLNLDVHLTEKPQKDTHRLVVSSQPKLRNVDVVERITNYNKHQGGYIYITR